ncbi:MAG TPA: hypothetical protein VH207_10150 [Chthoniobacterales bacterium]|nr:hypothetical protein [Chthoniobacterales bacterium]
MKIKLNTLFSKAALASLVAGAMTFGSAGPAGAQAPFGTCGLSTLSGTYAFATHGYNIVSGAPVPKAIVETIQFNGDGTLVAPFATVSINGTVIHNSGATGTYTVNADCTGTISFAPGPSFDLVIGRAANQLWMIQTVDPSGAGPVFEGTATKVAR